MHTVTVEESRKYLCNQLKERNETVKIDMLEHTHIDPFLYYCKCYWNKTQVAELFVVLSGLRGLEVTFPPHDPAEVVEFLRTEKFREQVLREGL
jgi:hypothetical protein